MNIQGQELESLVDKYLDREWAYIKTIDFPSYRAEPIKEESVKNEWNSLQTKDLKWNTRSSAVMFFNDSIFSCNKAGKNSPREFWEKLKQDKQLFKKFLTNRYKCSDWYKEKAENWKWLEEGRCPEYIYAVGMDSSGFSPKPSYFKPHAMKQLIKKYAGDVDVIFDPFAGFCGRLFATLAVGKKYIGWDVSDLVIEENVACAEWVRANCDPDVEYVLECHDSLSESGDFSDAVLITCPPYSDLRGKQIEEWRMKNGDKITCESTCEEIIDYCVANYKCKRYVFVVDGSIMQTKYADKVVDEFTNVNYFGYRNGKPTSAAKNSEPIVVIDGES